MEKGVRHMILPVVRIGNSRGIRLPKVILEQCRITDQVEVDVNNDNITLRPHRQPRQGWAEQMKKMHERGDDELLIPDNVDPGFDGWEW
jgi:antitoxin MazE